MQGKSSANILGPFWSYFLFVITGDLSQQLWQECGDNWENWDNLDWDDLEIARQCQCFKFLNIKVIGCVLIDLMRSD